MFGHDIIELPEIPRQRDKLVATLAVARAARRTSNLMRWAALNIFVWTIIILAMYWL